MAHADPGRDRQPLLVLVGADRGVDHLVGDEVGELGPVPAGDQLQHQVGRGGAAGGGVAVAVDDVDVRGELDLGEVLLEAVAVLPVDGAAAAVEQPRLGDHLRAGADRADRAARAAPRGGARSGPAWLIACFTLRPPTTRITASRAELGRARRPACSATPFEARHRPAGLAHHLPLVERPPGHAVGDAAAARSRRRRRSA